MRLGDVAGLPPTLNTDEAAQLLGVSRDTLWRLAREGTAPVEPLRLGSALRWPTARLADLLGIPTAPAAPDQTEPLNPGRDQAA